MDLKTFHTLVFAYAALITSLPRCCGFSDLHERLLGLRFAFHFVFKMQENANELQYPEASKAQDEPWNWCLAHTSWRSTSWEELNLRVQRWSVESQWSKVSVFFIKRFYTMKTTFAVESRSILIIWPSKMAIFRVQHYNLFQALEKKTTFLPNNSYSGNMSARVRMTSCCNDFPQDNCVNGLSRHRGLFQATGAVSCETWHSQTAPTLSLVGKSHQLTLEVMFSESAHRAHPG